MDRITLASQLLATLLLYTATAHSQAARQLEEIVVTANKRSSALLETPTALTVFNARALANFSIDTAQDLAARTPSLSMAGTPSKISIRGVGRPNNALGSDPGVAIYADGVYTCEAGLFEYANLFDVERIEVLRGPQGTLYGRNAVGGAINLISVAPSVQWHSKVIAELGNYDSEVLQGYFSGPVTADFSMTLAASTIYRSGFQEAVNNAVTYGLGLTIGFYLNGWLFTLYGSQFLFGVAAAAAAVAGVWFWVFVKQTEIVEKNRVL